MIIPFGFLKKKEIGSGGLLYTEDFASYSTLHGDPNTEVFDFSGLTWTNVGTHNFRTITGNTVTGNSGATGGTLNGVQDPINPFCYFEASGGNGNTGNTGILESDVIDASVIDPYIRLYYHFWNGAFDDNLVEFRIEAWDGSTWNTLSTTVGEINGVSTTQADNYIQLIGDATSYTNGDFRFRLVFDLTITLASSSARDACIDNIEIFNGTP